MVHYEAIAIAITVYCCAGSLHEGINRIIKRVTFII